MGEIGKYQSGDYAVIELSSFQLMDIKSSPHIAVVLDIGSEHLDYHKSIQEYQSAKLNIAKFQKPEDWLVITGKNLLINKFKNVSEANEIEVYGEIMRAPDHGSVWWRNDTMETNVKEQSVILNRSELPLAGEHNKINAAAAVAVGLILNINKETIVSAIKKFKNLPQRLETIGSFGGVEFINDSASTNPTTTEAAIRAYDQPILLVIGGKNKGLEYDGLINKISGQENIRKVYVIGALEEDIKKLCSDERCNKFEYSKTLDNTIKRIKEDRKPGDIVLFSPGAASFDQFKNYVTRGQKFNQLVHEHFASKI